MTLLRKRENRKFEACAKAKLYATYCAIYNDRHTSVISPPGTKKRGHCSQHFTRRVRPRNIAQSFQAHLDSRPAHPSPAVHDDTVPLDTKAKYCQCSRALTDADCDGSSRSQRGCAQHVRNSQLDARSQCSVGHENGPPRGWAGLVVVLAR